MRVINPQRQQPAPEQAIQRQREPDQGANPEPRPLWHEHLLHHSSQHSLEGVSVWRVHAEDQTGESLQLGWQPENAADLFEQWTQERYEEAGLHGDWEVRQIFQYEGQGHHRQPHYVQRLQGQLRPA